MNGQFENLVKLFIPPVDEGYDLILLEKPLPDSSNRIEEAGVRFAALPMTVARHGTPTTSLNVVGIRPSYPGQLIRTLTAIDLLLQNRVDVINLSLGPSTELPSSMADPDPLYVAIQTAAVTHHVPVVVAAGNKGPGQGTMQFLARSVDVISVGGLDEHGLLVDTSSRGVPDVSGPTVVADGRIDEVDPRFPTYSTSWAAPKVAVVCAWIKLWLMVIARDVDSLTRGKVPGTRTIKVPVVGGIDTGANQIPKPSLHTTELPFRKRHLDWYSAVWALFTKHALSPYISNDVASVRRTLRKLSRPMPGYKRFEVGAGHAGGFILNEFISELLPTTWVKWICEEDKVLRVPLEEMDKLDHDLGPLWDVSDQDVMIDHLNRGIVYFSAQIM